MQGCHMLPEIPFSPNIPLFVRGNLIKQLLHGIIPLIRFPCILLEFFLGAGPLLFHILHARFFLMALLPILDEAIDPDLIRGL